MKNKLSDLNNHLFAQLERLSDEDLTAEQLLLESDRSRSIINISRTIIETASITLDVMKMMERSGVKMQPFANNLLSPRNNESNE